MQKYMVITLSVGGANNRIYTKGNVVIADMFEANVTALIKDGSIVEYDGPLPVTGTDEALQAEIAAATAPVEAEEAPVENTEAEQPAETTEATTEVEAIENAGEEVPAEEKTTRKKK